LEEKKGKENVLLIQRPEAAIVGKEVGFHKRNEGNGGGTKKKAVKKREAFGKIEFAQFQTKLKIGEGKKKHIKDFE